VLVKKPKIRRFIYEPRFYKPDRDPGERLKRQMRTERSKHRGRVRPAFVWAILFVLIMYAYLYLSGVVR
jgi:hypothetical protein